MDEDEGIGMLSDGMLNTVEREDKLFDDATSELDALFEEVNDEPTNKENDDE